MTNRPLVCEYFIVVPTLKGFVSEEVDFVKLRVRQEIQTISLVPSFREAVKRNLTSNTVCYKQYMSTEETKTSGQKSNQDRHIQAGMGRICTYSDPSH